MSNFLLLNGLDEEAINICKQGLQINSDDEYLINNLLIGYVNSERFDIALEYLTKYIEKYPNASVYWKLLGDIFCQIGEDKGAIICYKKALDINSEDICEVKQDIYYGLGICYAQVGEVKKSIEFYEKILKYNHTDPIVLLNVSKLYGYDLKEYEKAEYYAKKVIELYPQNGYGYHNLGLIYLHTARLEKAKWYLYKARRLIPEYQPVHDAIVELKRKQYVF
ncbi:tetratricopeptide repeat protein [Crassaminicella thermophila]|nr:tetratricopeptide repeat protein [Crassaminicella thermophila]